jgi:hypothetical protein
VSGPVTGRALGAGAVACVVVLAALVSTRSDDGPGVGEARLEVDGEAIVERRDGDSEVVRDHADLERGDRVEITDGVGRLLLSGGTRMELRSGLGDAGDSMLVMGEVPELEAGDLLVAAPEGSTIEAAGTSVAIDAGAARVRRALGVGVRAYDGTVSLDSAGQERAVPALREMLVPALGRPPQEPRPIAYDAADPWDRRFLGDAMALGQRLEALADGYTRTLNPGEGRTPGFFRLVLPGLDDEPAFTGELIDTNLPPGEILIGAAISELGARGQFPERWSSVFTFRNQGAAWGLVAMDQAVSGTPLLGAIEQAVQASPTQFVDAAATATGPASGSSSSGSNPSAGGTGPGSAPSAAGPTATTSAPTPTTLPPPPTTPTLSDSPIPLPLPQGGPTQALAPVLEPVVEPVVEVVGGLLNGLLGILAPPATG